MRLTGVTVALAMVSLSAGCASTKATNDAPQGCHSNIQIKNKKNQPIEVDLPTATVCTGDTVVLHLSNGQKKGSARTRASSGNQVPWLDAENATKKKIEWIVPTSLMGGEEYKYDIEIDGFDPLDPRIVVQKWK
jgi:ABC-type Fe3+-hydroxamate transport system substrate-binding protein